ncbi:MAG: hypothetical protein A2Z04_07830 [Chloroflexi bacterium RBG_16_57_9]|nr:MAG: hypothetical protein A2Z04_07830 [Chloroflexi bacterium RBG_16_57_9]
MSARITRYLERLENTIRSRGDVEIEALEIVIHSDRPGRTSEFYARIVFLDNSLLEVEEALVARRLAITKARYVYHYQAGDGSLIFRYDNAPHYPKLPNFPYHKHVGDRVESAELPDLHDVLKEIDGLTQSVTNPEEDQDVQESSSC